MKLERSLLVQVANAVMGTMAETAAEDAGTSRNGYRERRPNTCVGIPGAAHIQAQGLHVFLARTYRAPLPHEQSNGGGNCEDVRGDVSKPRFRVTRGPSWSSSRHPGVPGSHAESAGGVRPAGHDVPHSNAAGRYETLAWPTVRIPRRCANGHGSRGSGVEDHEEEVQDVVQDGGGA